MMVTRAGTWQREQPASWRGILVFSLLALVLAWCVAAPLWYFTAGVPVFGDRSGLVDPAALQSLGESQAFVTAVAVLPSAMMFTPLLAAWITLRWVEGVRFREMLRVLGVVAAPGVEPAQSRSRALLRLLESCALGILGTCVLVAASVGVAVACGWLHVDTTFPAIGPAAAQAGLPVGALVAAQLAMIPFAAVLPNGLLAAGEELGWRGYLLPALVSRTGVSLALLLSGVVWGVWHAPLILLGYNFARPDMTGVLLMIAGCIGVGAWFSWLRLRCRTVWPAVVAHGALNGAAGIYLLIGGATPADGALAGPLGAAGWIVCGAGILVWTIVAAVRGRESVKPTE
ncbi:CPBP family intramembrane glutamic endopeptidase [Brevibacterium sp.]|uniref:CPBP family intramembrane glutamic endopeptidase n=1 Tax=Brevibacterium sp. TaxID=1701 RepID=UPI0025B96883|nr:CPBP family intramembrane glutamic endopeptidase [Brevibacterium sp.]